MGAETGCLVRHFPTCYCVGLRLEASRDIKSFYRFSVTPVYSEDTV